MNYVIGSHLCDCPSAQAGIEAQDVRRAMSPNFAVIHFQAEAHDITFLRARSFFKEASRIFTQEEFSGFMNYIAANPEAGPKIPGAFGLRKIRWKAKGAGKRGGARVIYYFRDLNMPLLLLAAYPKNEVARLSHSRMKEIERKLEYVIAEWTSVQSTATAG